jgi:hypothetical protein
MPEENKKSYADLLRAAVKNKSSGPAQKKSESKVNKNSQVAGGATVVRRSGRGG